MAKLNNKLWLDTGKNKVAIDLYDTTNDFYSKKGLPIELRNGQKCFAPLVTKDDIYKTPLTVEDTGKIYYIGTATVNTTQKLESNRFIEIRLSGNSEKELEYDTFSFVVPFSGKVHIFSQALARQNGSGYSGNSWQWANLYFDVDGQNKKTLTIRRSQGEQWFTIFNESIQLNAGLHTIRFRFRGKCSSKDSHYSYAKGWKNVITLPPPS